MNASSDTDRGLVRLAARQSVSATLDRLESLLKERGITLFARIDFSGDAARAGLEMPAEQQLIFGNPKAGTPLMLANATSALDLPIKVICWEDSEGKTWLAYNDPAYIIKRHGLPEALAQNLAAVVPLIQQATQ